MGSFSAESIRLRTVGGTEVHYKFDAGSGIRMAEMYLLYGETTPVFAVIQMVHKSRFYLFWQNLLITPKSSDFALQ